MDGAEGGEQARPGRSQPQPHQPAVVVVAPAAGQAQRLHPVDELGPRLRRRNAVPHAREHEQLGTRDLLRQRFPVRQREQRL